MYNVYDEYFESFASSMESYMITEYDIGMEGKFGDKMKEWKDKGVAGIKKVVGFILRKLREIGRILTGTRTLTATDEVFEVVNKIIKTDWTGLAQAATDGVSSKNFDGVKVDDIELDAGAIRDSYKDTKRSQLKDMNARTLTKAKDKIEKAVTVLAKAISDVGPDNASAVQSVLTTANKAIAVIQAVIDHGSSKADRDRRKGTSGTPANAADAASGDAAASGEAAAAEAYMYYSYDYYADYVPSTEGYGNFGYDGYDYSYWDIADEGFVDKVKAGFHKVIQWIKDRIAWILTKIRAIGKIELTSDASTELEKINGAKYEEASNEAIKYLTEENAPAMSITLPDIDVAKITESYKGEYKAVKTVKGSELGKPLSKLEKTVRKVEKALKRSDAKEGDASNVKDVINAVKDGCAGLTAIINQGSKGGARDRARAAKKAERDAKKGNTAKTEGAAESYLYW